MVTTTTPSLPCPVFDHGTILLRTPATARSTKRARSHGAPSTTLPDDALLEIFARLPAKSVGRLRCVSRSWAATLKSDPFVDLHLREANRHQQPTPKLFFTTAHPDNRWHLDEVLTKPCHGLVLIRRPPHRRHFVCNPSTGALLPLPDSYNCRRRNGESYGLGYSPVTKEHKVVRLFSSFRSTPCCEVFSLDVSAHWRAVARRSPPSRAAVRGDPAVLCDGYLHFLQVRRKHGGSILTFDVGDETFGSLSTPPSVQDDDSPPELTVLGGRLCLCVFHERRPPTRSDADPYCIWRLACRESGYWEKLYRVLHHQTLRPELDLLRVHWVSPLETYLAGNGRTKIMFATEEGVLAFDLEGGGVPVPEVLVADGARFRRRRRRSHC
ncbi:F-box only protein 8-like [Triticum aestivum]|uniref:F-box only protein 8-like n=1 Tax=Triticum aestivum TaxID=4565 RepID=UPI001D026598|nr:F-box only protein 8-like [Triticum aestivum]